jgi:hypothetical protein
MSDDRGNETGQLRRKVSQSLRALGSDLEQLDEAVADRAGLQRTDLRCLEIVARGGRLLDGFLDAARDLVTSQAVAQSPGAQ